MFCTTIGLKNANYEKRERLLVDEVNANNEQTKALAEQWLDSIKSGMDTANEMFGLNLNIKLKEDTVNADNNGPVQLRSDSVR
jgi:hypothetical protein